MFYHPMTWFEKGLNATVVTWNSMCAYGDQGKKVTAEQFEQVLGRCSFAHFCLKKMVHNKQTVVEEDRLYFLQLLSLVENRIDQPYWNDTLQEYSDCLTDILRDMQSCLQSPSNI